MSAYTAGDSVQATTQAFAIDTPLPGTDRIAVAMHRDRPVSPASLQALYDHVGWGRPVTESELGDVLSSGPAVGAWDGDELVGIVRALSDGHLAAYVEDVMVHERCRHLGVGSALMARLLRELEDVAVVTLFCAPSTGPFYEQQGFRANESAVMQRHRSA